jgi:hypothetical protein
MFEAFTYPAGEKDFEASSSLSSGSDGADALFRLVVGSPSGNSAYVPIVLNHILFNITGYESLI